MEHAVHFSVIILGLDAFRNPAEMPPFRVCNCKKED